MYTNSDSKTLKAVAFGFALAYTIICGFGIIPLIWMVPMTIKTYHMYEGKEENDSLAFDILAVIFLSPVSGILLLVDYFIMEDKKNANVVDAKMKVDGEYDNK